MGLLFLGRDVGLVRREANRREVEVECRSSLRDEVRRQQRNLARPTSTYVDRLHFLSPLHVPYL